VGREHAAADQRRASGPTFRLRSPRALGHVLRAPGQLGLGRAYVSGEIEVDDMDAALDLLDGYRIPPLHPRGKARLTAAAVRAGALRSVARAPTTELRPTGRRHSRDRDRDRRAVTHHYDISNEFFGLVLGESMTYSCAIFSRGAQTLEEAQLELELVCAKLGLSAGQRVLDLGCGWGSFALHAARQHDVHVTAITLSEPQAALARERAAAAGLADRIEIRVADYRDLAGDQFDAIASIGMVEHVDRTNIDAYARQLAAVLRPGGRLLNHGIARLRHGDPEAGPFSERFVFPDAAPLHLSRVLTAIEVDARRELPARLRPHAARVGAQPRRARRIARRPGAHASLAAVPARSTPRVRDRLHVDLPSSPPPTATPPNPPPLVDPSGDSPERSRTRPGRSGSPSTSSRSTTRSAARSARW
jgi:cyclopropane-fatty-acyl-phospholipid synthase